MPMRRRPEKLAEGIRKYAQECELIVNAFEEWEHLNAHVTSVKGHLVFLVPGTERAAWTAIIGKKPWTPKKPGARVRKLMKTNSEVLIANMRNNESEGGVLRIRLRNFFRDLEKMRDRK